MSIISKFENKVEDAVDGAAGAVFKAPIEPAQIAKRAEKQMKREKLVGSGRQYAPTLYNVLVNPRDDKRLFGFYPTMANEIANYLYARGTDAGMEFDARPLVRFIVDSGLKSGKFDVIAENVSAPIIQQLREEEQEYYGIKPKSSDNKVSGGRSRADAEAERAGRGHMSQDDILDRGGQVQTPVHDQAKQAVRGDRSGVRRGAADFQLPIYEPLVSKPVDGLDVAVNPQVQPDYDDRPKQASEEPQIVQEKQAARFEQPERESQESQAERFEQPARASLAPQESQVARTVQAASNFQAQQAQEEDLDLSIQPATGNSSVYNLSENRRIYLDLRQMTAGRGSNNNIVLADANASRIHLQFIQDAIGKWKLIDLNSTNGTLLNDMPITTAILRDGDQITVGMTILEFRQ